ncbi:MAG: amidohydrolase [Ferrimicrobium sp.]
MGQWHIMAQRSYLQGKSCESDSSCIEVDNQADREIHLDADCLLWPGFIDFHAHLSLDNRWSLGVSANDLLRVGVFGAADAGTLGWGNISATSDQAEFPYKRWVSLLPEGLMTHPIVPRYQGMTPEAEARMHQVFQLHKESIVGIKIRLGQHDRLDDERLLLDGIRIADSLGVGLMVHFTDTFLPLSAVVAALRPGDVLTHIFHGRRGSILTNGHLDPAVADAVNLGVLLDVGHGSKHFSWPVFQQALAEGLLPDTISTDITRHTINQAPLFHLPFVCSKLANAGLTWNQIYQSTVARPLAYLGLEVPSDSVVVLQPRYEPVAFGDTNGNIVEGSCWWDPVLVIFERRVIWNGI